MNQILQLNSFIHSEQTVSIVNGPSLTLDHISVDAKVTIDESLYEMIRRTLKKSLPSVVSIQLLYASDTVCDTPF